MLPKNYRNLQFFVVGLNSLADHSVLVGVVVPHVSEEGPMQVPPGLSSMNHHQMIQDTLHQLTQNQQILKTI